MDEEKGGSWSINNFESSLKMRDKIPGDPKNWKWSEHWNKWKFVDDKFVDEEVERVSQDLEYIYRGVIEKMVEDRVYAPSLDEAKVILTHIALESAHDPSSSHASQNACKPTVDFIDSQVDLESIKDTLPKNHTLYHEKIATDPDEYDYINSAASNCRTELNRVGFFERLNLETSDELALFITRNLDTFEPSVVQESSESGSYAFVSALLHDIHMSEEAQNEVARLCLEYVSRQTEDPEKNEELGEYQHYFDEFTEWGRTRLISPIELDMDTHNFKSYMHIYIAENGLPRVLNMLRSDLSEPEKEAKARKMILYMLGIEPSEDNSKVTDRNVDEFYNAIFIEPKEYLLNTNEAKTYRINMVSDILRNYGIPDGASVSEFACGTGWLSGGLESQGFRVHAFDRHPTMVELGNKDYPNVSFMRFDWNRWQEWKELKESMIPENSQDAVVVNGRSDRHMQYPYETMGEIASILKDGGLYMSDSPDVETQGTFQQQQLSKNRDLHEMFDFYRPWLEKYFWYTVGAPKGQDGVAHLIESWVPSQELKILYAEANALKHMETIVEPNYDGHGSNNNYFVFQRVSREEEHDFKEQALKRIDEYFANQPKDPSKWGRGDTATYRD